MFCKVDIPPEELKESLSAKGVSAVIINMDESFSSPEQAVRDMSNMVLPQDFPLIAHIPEGSIVMFSNPQEEDAFNDTVTEIIKERQP